MAREISFSRFITSSNLLVELNRLRLFPFAFDVNLLRLLEEYNIMYPRVTIHFPESISRRMWQENHPEVSVIGECEPDGSRYECARSLLDMIFKWNNSAVYGIEKHPADLNSSDFMQFIYHEPHNHFIKSYRIDVSNQQYGEIYDDSSDLQYYSTSNILYLIEHASVCHILPLCERQTFGRILARDAQLTPEQMWISISVHANMTMSFIMENRHIIDSVVEFVEESNRWIGYKLRDRSRRFILSRDESAEILDYKKSCAVSVSRANVVSRSEIVALCRVLGDRWHYFEELARPAISGVYKQFLGRAVEFLKLAFGVNFDDANQEIGTGEYSRNLLLDVVWPDWTVDEKQRLVRTLCRQIYSNNDSLLHEFANYINNNGLEAIFWRLKSFEEHAFRGNSFAVHCMRSDLQGLSLAIEHLCRKLGGKANQLYRLFKNLYNRNHDILRALNDAENLTKSNVSWESFLIELDGFDTKNIVYSKVVDMLIAHKIRGSSHEELPFVDYFQLEKLFVSVLRSGFHAFCESRSAGP